LLTIKDLFWQVVLMWGENTPHHPIPAPSEIMQG